MTNFDYQEPAELYASTSLKGGRRPVSYRRFQSAAEAIQYAIEELDPAMLRGTVIEVADDRLDAAQIRELYDSEGYPLTRRLPM
ncbi:MAG TPA: hypothetical protein VG900_03325 [Hyphomicrobiaceae bacterium]|nr:hypothetical protein [Hyphomicrobiaceae bacterium]